MRFKKVLGILRTKIRLLLMIGVLLAAAAGCQFAGEYLHSHYIREEASETSGNISEKKTVVIDSGHGGKDPGKVGINGAQEKELNLQIAEKLKKYLEEHQKLPTVFMADNDLLACRALRVFKEKGIRVPDEVSFVGFDNRTICSFVEPSMTTIQLPAEEMGELAVELLMKCLEHSLSTTMKYKINPKIVINNSVRKMI